MTVFKLNGLTKNKLTDYRIKPEASVLVLNIMPNKVVTENQITQLFSDIETPVAVTFMYPRSHNWQHGDQQDLAYHYVTLDAVREQYFDGLIVTGAPLEKLEFTDVDFWDEFLEIREWSRTHTKYQLFTCWGAQAALFTDFNLPKINVDKKIFGVFENQLSDTDLPSGFRMPQSRFSKVDSRIAGETPNLEILGDNSVSGPLFLRSKAQNSLYVMGHPEYQADTLGNEYYRDLQKGTPVDLPHNLSVEHPEESYERWHKSSIYLYQTWINEILEEKNYERKQLQI
ncbi:homoserine O-acetyltransferase/O-succinyltransferase family protein [Companilactobacillus mishanensis]|uniref:Homoserine O-acetyltransferase n=1 Tax=Companilactobacillus mishanensis TaxID=2486008 RepID=A0A5P0ZHW6_9LACO|nr:homoserine O-succinyltransferase [Companilactobacillus mishanensis]MQS52588.1 homoserine O-succinyltransferase [Companilactobacillus mishanensis]